jgi:hypothetical protein
MAGRKRHSAEDIVRKLRRADELAAEGKTGEEIAAELEVSALSVVEWWAVLRCWVISHCRSSFRAPGRPTWPYPTQPRFRPAAYRSAIRKGGTFVGDGTLGTRWSGLVECVRHFR